MWFRRIDARSGNKRRAVEHHYKHPACGASPQLLTRVSLWAILQSVYGTEGYRFEPCGVYSLIFTAFRGADWCIRLRSGA